MEPPASIPLPTQLCLLASATILLLFSGCETYRADPLDLSAHKEGWKLQRVSDDKVKSFAKLLKKDSPAPASFNPSNGLSMGEGEIVALVYNPDLRVARQRVGVAEASAKFAGLWEDPEFSLDLLKITSGVPDPWIVSGALPINIPLSGRLKAEKAEAEAELNAELERVIESEWKVRRDVRDAWLLWSAQRLQMNQAESFVAKLDSIVESTSRLEKAGELPKTEAALFAIERESRRAEIARLKGEVAESIQLIRALMGISPQASAKLMPTLSAGSVPSAKEPQEGNPTLARLRAEYQVAERTLLREIRKQYPDITLGPQAESDEGQSRIGFVSAIPIPILNSNKGGIAVAKAERAAARAAFETEYERISGKIAAAQAKQQGVLARRKSVNDNLVPLVDRQVEDARQLLELGEGGSLVLLESLVRAHEAKIQLIEIELEEAKTGNEIRFLVGPEVSK